MSSGLKDIAKHFLELCAIGKSREAFQLYVSDAFIHHNAYFKGDRETLMIAMEDAQKESPNKIFIIKNTIVDDNMVALHSYLGFDNVEMAVVHILRFEDGKIVEMGDLGQPFAKDSPNENGMF